MVRRKTKLGRGNEKRSGEERENESRPWRELKSFDKDEGALHPAAKL